jgi:hypothetical protein
MLHALTGGEKMLRTVTNCESSKKVQEVSKYWSGSTENYQQDLAVCVTEDIF